LGNPEAPKNQLSTAYRGFGIAGSEPVWCRKRSSKSRTSPGSKTGRMIPAAEARDAGLISEAVPAESLVDRALAIGEQLSGQSAFAMTKIRQLILANTNEDDAPAAMHREGEALAAAYRSWEHKEAIDAFLSKRPADFQKQAPTPVE
jgi:enoyl-CoA hydratase/carnithine racemase